MLLPEARDVAFIYVNDDGTYTIGVTTKQSKMVQNPVTGELVKSDEAFVRRAVCSPDAGAVIANAVAEFRKTNDKLEREFIGQKQTPGERKRFNASSREG